MTNDNNPGMIRFDTMQSHSFNPLNGVMNTDAGREFLIALFAQMAQVDLSPDRRAGYLHELASLPQPASMADFIRAAKEYEASTLGVSVAAYEAVFPLIDALANAQTSGLYGRIFDSDEQGKPRDEYWDMCPPLRLSSAEGDRVVGYDRDKSLALIRNQGNATIPFCPTGEDDCEP